MTGRPPACGGDNAGFKRVLSLSSLIFHGAAFMVPLTIFTTYGLVTGITRGMVPQTYLLTTVWMSIVALSYSRMASIRPSAGSVYEYASASINPHVGFMSGWILLLGYVFLPLLNYLISSIFLSSVFPGIPRWIWIPGLTLIVTMVNILGITVADRVNRVIVIAQIAFLAGFTLILIRHIFSFRDGLPAVTAGAPSFTPVGDEAAAMLSGASILALSYLGFDAIATLGEEAENPTRDIPRATMIVCAGGGLIFVFVAYLMQTAWPEAWREMNDPDGGAYELILRTGGSLTGYAFTLTYTAGCLASSISAVASASRILYRMGRNRVLPRTIFGYLHRSYRTPSRSILIIGAASLPAMCMSLSAAVSLLNFGALLSFCIINVTVIFHDFIRRKKRHDANIVRGMIVPSAGAVISLIVWSRLSPLSIILGLGWISIGLTHLAISTSFFRKHPNGMNM